jgi:hypothetical protein
VDVLTLKKERRNFEKKIFLTSFIASLPVFLLLYLTRDVSEAAAFFLSQLAVALDIILISELSGMVLAQGEGTASRIALALILKLVLLLGGLYVILSLFYRRPLGLFIGLSLPLGVALFWAVSDARKERWKS